MFFYIYNVLATKYFSTNTVLYSKYRSQTFGSIIGQEVITTTLSNAVAGNQVGHAYVFSGPRGTGKTSSARILAKAINCENRKKDGEPCNKCDSCVQITEGRAVDVLEIDAASHTSVDDVRDLIEKVSFSPVSLKKKVYIIDEVHMLSRSAFNALLKTLEEPPKHVIFILATTEVHKIPITVLSRCQRFDFKLGSDKDILKVLKNIVKGEGIKIEVDAFKYIVDMAQGSYRDAISVMERILSKSDLTSDKLITGKEVRDFLGIPDEEKFERFYKLICEKETTKALSLLDSIVKSGEDIKIFSSYFLSYLRKQLINLLNSNDVSTHEIFLILKEFSSADKNYSSKNAWSAPIMQLPLEIAIINLTLNKNQAVDNTNKVDVGKIKNKNLKVIAKKSKAELRKTEKSRDSTGGEPLKIDLILSKWQQFIEAAKPFNGHLHAFISKSKVSQCDESNNLILSVPYDFYKERIEDSRSQKILKEIGQEVFGINLGIKCVVKKKSEKLVENNDTNPLDDALDVFGEDVV